MAYLRDLSLGVGDVVMFDGTEGSKYVIIETPSHPQENVWRLKNNKNPKFFVPFNHSDCLMGFTVVSRAKRNYTIEEFL